ncbi:MAG: hydrogenase iron-sulfur subunit [Desulfobacteraceae bacterium]|nr:hydrogenase iron-sulfur subunit [Desulfobacteraceae bacterium]
MTRNAKTGVFLCRCGEQIAPLIDLDALADQVRQDENVAYCDILPYPCLNPGLDAITAAVVDKGLNRLVIAGCESRLMLKKFEKAFESMELLKGQIDMVNLRGHIAASSDLSPEKRAEKGARLIKAAAAEMTALAPTIQQRAFLEGPVMLVGGGAAAWTAAQELARQELDFMMAPDIGDPQTLLDDLHQQYPGEWKNYPRLEKIRQEVLQSPHLTMLPPGELVSLAGVTGDYKLTFSEADGSHRLYKAGAVIACLDCSLSPPAEDFGYDGETVIIQPEFDDYLTQKGIFEDQVVFWVNDYEAGYPEFAQLSALSAWAMARRIRESYPKSQAVILYNEQMELPLTAQDRALARKLGVLWVPYDKTIRPTIQEGFITIGNLNDHVEYDIPWDLIVLSPERGVTGQTLESAKILGLAHKEGRFLTGHHARVRPEQVGREETYMAGSARFPCDLHETLVQGYRAGKKTADLFRKSKAGELFVPRIVCSVDPDKCVSCGLCQELCDCGGIGIEEATGGGLPRVVDPLRCTGGGTCAAACPYKALTLQNNTTEQREARISGLARQMGPDDVIALGCAWGGLPAADNAGKKGLCYDPRVHIMGVPCVGQLDPGIFARAFLDGAPGLILLGCNPEECHHSYGVDHAWSRVNMIKKLLTMCGFDRRRIALAHADLNAPEELVRTINSFVNVVSAVGPIERTPQNISRLESMYDLVSNNPRIRHLLCVTLRQNHETEYKGNLRHALDFDRDFSAAIKEEFLRTRVLKLLQAEKRPLRLNELSSALMEKREKVGEQLWSMVHEGLIHRSHQNHEALFTAG